VKVNRGQFEVIVSGKTIAAKTKDIKNTSTEREYRKAEMELLKDAKTRLYNSRDHIADFIQCVGSRQKPITHEGIGGGSAIACHLMNIAYRTGKKFQWDPAKNAIVGGGVDASELSRSYRSPWKV